jgi:outer membrane protein
LYVRGSWGTGFSSYGKDSLGISYSDQLDGNSNSTLLLGISIPIFNNWQVNNNISNAKVRLYDAEYSLDQVKQQLYKSIQQSYNDAISASEKYNSAIEAVNSYKESFHYTEQKFNVGIVNSVEYNIAKNNFIKAESDLLQAKYEYIFAVKILDFYRGIPITL